MQSHYVCARHGRVTPKAIKGVDKTTKTKRVSGGKATAALLTGGASVLVTGIRSKKDSKTTVMVCPKCKREVQAV